jgi:hypothetical protein
MVEGWGRIVRNATNLFINTVLSLIANRITHPHMTLHYKLTLNF